MTDNFQYNEGPSLFYLDRERWTAAHGRKAFSTNPSIFTILVAHKWKNATVLLTVSGESISLFYRLNSPKKTKLFYVHLNSTDRTAQMKTPALAFDGIRDENSHWSQTTTQ